MEAKVLDFDWIFTADNAAKFVKILAETKNDEIFASAQVRVFVNFMWYGYYEAIYSSLFIPFLFYFFSFLAFATMLGENPSKELDLHYVLELACLVIFGKTFVTFLLLEVV